MAAQNFALYQDRAALDLFCRKTRRRHTNRWASPNDWISGFRSSTHKGHVVHGLSCISHRIAIISNIVTYQKVSYHRSQKTVTTLSEGSWVVLLFSTFGAGNWGENQRKFDAFLIIFRMQ